MYVHYSPGYPAPHQETYFGALAVESPMTVAHCLSEVRALEAIMPDAWDGLSHLVALRPSVPGDRECLLAYERLRGAFSALHRSCVIEARRLMADACEDTPMKLRANVIARAVIEGAVKPALASTALRTSMAGETLRTANWIDPRAFRRAMRGTRSYMPIPSICAPASEWIAYARAARDGHLRRNRNYEPPREEAEVLSCAVILPWRDADDAAKRNRTMRSVIANLQLGEAPGTVDHIVAVCLSSYTLFEELLTRPQIETRD